MYIETDLVKYSDLQSENFLSDRVFRLQSLFTKINIHYYYRTAASAPEIFISLKLTFTIIIDGRKYYKIRAKRAKIFHANTQILKGNRIFLGARSAQENFEKNASLQFTFINIHYYYRHA